MQRADIYTQRRLDLLNIVNHYGFVSVFALSLTVLDKHINF